MTSTCSFNIIFATPAIASDPYCEVAPSLNISMRSIEATGIALKSVPTVPRPTVPLTFNKELLWRRFPFIKTKI